MGDFAANLDEICAALEAVDYRAPEQFAASTVEIGKKTALAMANEMLALARSGAADVEVMAVFPFTLAFLVNVFVYCAEARGNAIVVDEILDAARTIAHNLGGAELLSAGKKPSLSCN